MLSKQDELMYQKAQENYRETQRRKDELPEKYKKLFKQLERLEIGRYGVAYSDVITIAEVYQNNALNAFDTFFLLGFMKGQRSERARQKKKKEY